MSETAKNDQNILERLIGILKDIFSPVLPAITAAGLLQGVTILLLTLGVLTEESSTYIILSSASNVVFHFLPVLLAISSSKVFEVNTYISASIALLLFHPDLVSLFTSDMQTRFIGIPVIENDYSSSVIPIILIVWAQSYIEPWTRRIIPDLVSGIFTPMLTLVITSFVALVILGPIGMGFGAFLGQALQWLGNTVGEWAVPTLLGGFGLFAVMTGAHYTLMPVMFNQLGSQGYETFFAAGMLATNLALAGAILGIMLKSKNRNFRQYSSSAFVTAMLGISQPGLYGVALQFKRVMIGSILGGLAGGFIGGVTDFVAYAYVNPGLAALPVYMNPDGSLGNIMLAIIIMVVAFIVAFIYVYSGDIEDISDEDIKKMQDDPDDQNQEDKNSNHEGSSNESTTAQTITNTQLSMSHVQK